MDKSVSGMRCRGLTGTRAEKKWTEIYMFNASIQEHLIRTHIFYI